MERKDGDPLYFLDWYSNGAYTSFIFPDDLDAYRQLIAKTVNMEVRIEERNGRVNYRVLNIMAKQAN